jgi:NAD(P)-dependent dehydrogenase (short-subunit alcohol dehydrogenase family)
MDEIGIRGRLADRVAIVTGGATGIGAATAELYASEGAIVVVGDIRQAEGEQVVARITSAGGTARYFNVDVTADPQVRSLVMFAEENFGRVDVMTANAGILGRASDKDVGQASDEDFLTLMNVNVGGVFRAFKHAIPSIRRSGGGVMTATASTVAHRGYRQLHLYSASKAAIVALVRSMAVDLAPLIRVNAVSPGSVDTLFRHHTQGPDAGTGRQHAPGPGVARAIDIARVHLFLVSDDGAFVSGQAVIADRAYQMHGVIPEP